MSEENSEEIEREKRRAKVIMKLRELYTTDKGFVYNINCD